MSLPISSIQHAIAAIPDAAPALGGASSPGVFQPGVFQDVFTDAVNRVQSKNQEAHESVMKFLSGEGGEIHRVALAVHEAQSAFEMFTQVRNKVISAYQEVMRMQL